MHVISPGNPNGQLTKSRFNQRFGRREQSHRSRRGTPTKRVKIAKAVMNILVEASTKGGYWDIGRGRDRAGRDALSKSVVISTGRNHKW